MLSWRLMLLPLKKDKDRREGKGTCCCLGGRIDSIQGQYEELDEFIPFFKSLWCKYVAGLGKEFNQFCPPNSSDYICLLLCMYVFILLLYGLSLHWI